MEDIIIEFFWLILSYPGAIINWLLFKRKSSFDNYLKNRNKLKDVLTTLIAIITIWLLIHFCGCKSENSKELPKSFEPDQISFIQSKIDSAEIIYRHAIADANSGLNKNDIVDRYQNQVSSLHKRINTRIDSLYVLYINGYIDSTRYQSIIQSVKIDSIQVYQNKSKQLGIEFQLGE